LKKFTMTKMNLPKVAVLATGAAVALMVATISPQAAQASPSQAAACTGCHTAGGSVTATPSLATVAPGASYTVALAFTGGTGTVGYWISGNGESVSGSSASATMTAPATAGTYTYTAWVRQDVTSSATYTITVEGTPGATPPAPTTPATDAPTVPATDAPTVPAAGAPVVADQGAAAPGTAVIPAGAPDTGAGGTAN